MHASSTTSGTIETVVISTLAELEPHKEAWEALEDRALDDNFYMTSGFVTEVFRSHVGKLTHRVVFVYETVTNSRQLIGCAAFTVLAATDLGLGTALWSLVHPHCYLSHPLLDRGRAVEAFRRIWDWVERPGQPWCLAILHRMRPDSAVTQLVKRELAHRRQRLWVRESFPRVLLKPRESFEVYIQALSSGRRKNYGRLLRRLQGVGSVEMVVHRDLAGGSDLASRFMQIEAKSWKGEEGTALQQKPADREFFTNLTETFGNRKKLLWAEVKLNGIPIAMSVNFVTGSTLFGFKVGYDPQYADCSPGILAEVETMKAIHDDRGIRMAESGTLGKSYLDGWWLEHGEVEVWYVSTPKMHSAAILSVMVIMSRVKRGLRAQVVRVQAAVAGIAGKPRRDFGG